MTQSLANAELAVSDSDGGLDFEGTGTLDVGTTSAMEFTLTYTTIESGELAAWTSVASILLNLDETISKP